MKVLNVCTYDDGGAGRAAVRIMRSLQKVGVETKLLVREKKTSESDVYQVCDNRFKRFVAKVKGAINTYISEEDIMYEVAGIDISRHQLVREADIIILHWTNHFLSYNSIKKLIRAGKPIIWVMHDMWLLTGGCHCDRYCGEYKTGCKNCHYHGKEFKVSKKHFEKKCSMIENSNIVFVTPSTWLKKRALESRILSKQEVRVIHNPLDVTVYKCFDDKDRLKKKYGIPVNKKIVMFGTGNVNDPNKGLRYFISAIKTLDKEKYRIVMYGNKPDDEYMEDLYDTVLLGSIKDDLKMVEVLNCADVMVVPSDQDNYSNTVLESMACGVPVVAFDIGGMPDLICHKENGYIVQYKNIDDLKCGIEYCANNSAEMTFAAINKVHENNEYRIIGDKYYSLCKEFCDE